MPSQQSNIIAQLRQDILQLQGFKPALDRGNLHPGPGAIRYAFPNEVFPLGVIHEFIADGVEDMSATAGFTAGLLSSLMQKGGVCVWVSASRTLFPPALASFGVAPHQVIFIDLQKEKDIPWAIEEALKCEGLAAVVGEIPELSFTASRRMQLAVEQSRVTGFMLRQHPRKLNTTACVSRWKISSIPGESMDDLPGLGYPAWDVQLLKVRNGRPGRWQVSWVNGQFRYANPALSMVTEVHRKTG